MAKLYLLKTKYNKPIAYYFKPPYEEVENNPELYQILVWDSSTSDSAPANIVDIPPIWQPFHGKFEQYQHLYDFVGRSIGNKLETLSAMGKLNEPLQLQFDCSEVWEKGKKITENDQLNELRKHYLAMAGIFEDE